MIENSILMEHDQNYIKNYLHQFPGGKIVLNKNDKTGLATLCLDHPERRNAVSGQMMLELRSAVENLEKWTVGKAVIIYGRNGNFCSGGDLEMAKKCGSAQEGFDISSWMQETLRRLHKLPLISICLLEGFVLGGGAEISLFCDYLIAADNLKFGFVHGKMGIITAWGGTTRLVEKIGRRKALDLLLTSKIISAHEGLDLGLINYIVPSSGALIETNNWLNTLILHHHSIIHGFKEIIVFSESNSSDDSYRFEKNKFAPFWGGDLNRIALGKRLKHR